MAFLQNFGAFSFFLYYVQAAVAYALILAKMFSTSAQSVKK